MDILNAFGESDGRIILTLYNNNLEARGDFFPPMEEGAPISSAYIQALLEKANIVYGINQKEIELARKKCVEEHEIIRDVLVAKGDLPVDGVVEYIQLNPYLGQKKEVEAEAAVDHRARSPFIIVRKDQALAKRKHMKPGKDGKDVHGEIIGHRIKHPPEVSGGTNTRMEGDFLLSDINGQLVVTQGVVNVSESLLIKKNVGYATGNIIFPGDVEIHGAVSDGFKIYSGGSVTIKQTFDVTEATTKGDLNVAGGIIGRGQAVLKVGGDLKTKFIGNCKVACRKTISVEKEIINSHVYTLESLEMGDKGKIVGGEVYAVKGVRAGSIGKKTGKAARIHCGIDFTVEQEKEKANSLLRSLAVKTNRLRDLINDPDTDDEKKAKMEDLLLKLEEEQQKAQEKVSELLGKLDTDRGAVVEVKGEIVAGTLIEICQTALYVTEPLKKVRFRLDSHRNRLVTENL